MRFKQFKINKPGKRGVLPAAALIALAAAALSACGSGASSSASAGASAAPKNALPGVAAPSDSLVNQASTEGKVVWYNGNLTGSDAVITAFEKKYPSIKVTLLQLPGNSLQARFNSEAASGKVAADVITVGYSPSFFDADIEKGYLAPLSSTLPDFTKVYPKSWQLADGGTGVTVVVPFAIAINTDLVSDADAPKTWADLADPKWKGKLVAVDPNASVTGPEFWDVMIQKYGEDTVKKIGANIKRGYSSNGTQLAALAAGEGSVALFGAAPQINELVEKGAPLKPIPQPYTTGAQFATAVSGHAPDSAAAKVFASYLFSTEGQTILSEAEAGSVPLVPTSLPADYVQPNYQAGADQAKINKLLGVS